MKKLFFATLLTFVLVRVSAQTEEKLIADETNAQELKSSYKITTSNYFIPLEIVKQYGTKAKSYTVKNKKDRSGIYQEYVFYFKPEMKAQIESFILSLKRPSDEK